MSERRDLSWIHPNRKIGPCWCVLPCHWLPADRRILRKPATPTTPSSCATGLRSVPMLRETGCSGAHIEHFVLSSTCCPWFFPLVIFRAGIIAEEGEKHVPIECSRQHMTLADSDFRCKVFLSAESSGVGRVLFEVRQIERRAMPRRSRFSVGMLRSPAPVHLSRIPNESLHPHWTER
jgi:hypothetical protein